MEYFTADEIHSKKNEIATKLKKSIVWIHRDNQINNYLNKYLDKKNKVIDLGCGAGYLSEKLITEFGINDIELADIDDYREYKNSKSKKFYKINFNFDKFPFKDQYIDLAFAIQVLEHLENPFNFIREIRRTLKKNGLLFLSIPNGYNIFSRINFLLKSKIDGYRGESNHISFYPKDVFFKTLLKNFKLIDSFFMQRTGLFLRKISFKYPKSEFFSTKACYIFKKI